MILSRSRGLAAVTAFAGLAFVAFATLSPIQERPQLATQGLEHLAAFFVLGGLLQIAYPKQAIRTVVLLTLVAAGLEAAQHLTPDRHGTVVDFVRKGIGAVFGTAAGVALNRFAERRASRP